MGWPEVSIEDFPPERDDEPASLREDILDELTDHFVCALNRELLKNPDEQTAKQRVLNQFGDPVKIARQLWLDTMKEKIMSRRIMTGISAVMAVCSVAVVGIAWMLVEERRVANQELLKQMAAITARPVAPARSNTDEQILQELKRLNQAKLHEPPPNKEIMKQISFQLLLDDKETGPAIGFTGELKSVGKKVKPFTVNVVSDTNGKLDFGLLPLGAYQLKLKSPWNETYRNFDINMIPGRDYSQRIVCPVRAPDLVPVRLENHWANLLESGELFVLADFRESRFKQFYESDGRTFYYSSERKIHDNNWIYHQPIDQGVYLIGKDNKFLKLPLSSDGMYQDLDTEISLNNSTLHVPQGKYVLPVLFLIRKENLKRLSELNGKKYYPMISEQSDLIKSGAMYGAITTAIQPPFNTMNLSLETGNIVLPQRSKLLRFEASLGQTNVWKLDPTAIELTLQELNLSKK